MRDIREGDQQLPVPNNHRGITELVIADLKERERLGTARYGTTLQPHNGRDAMLDLYQELLDAAQYWRQVIEERGTANVQFRDDVTVDVVDTMGDANGRMAP